MHSSCGDVDPLVALVGPTGVGKSALAEALADHLPLEIVSLDSVQVYRGLDIGTAKPDRRTRARIPHHLIDIRDPAEPFSAVDFVSCAEASMAGIRARGRLPLLVGGTMLYLKAYREGLADLPEAEPKVRRRIDSYARRHGWPRVHKWLAGFDPDSAARIHPLNSQRLQRALEVYLTTGETMTERHARQAWQLRPVLQLAHVAGRPSLAAPPPQRSPRIHA